MAEQSHREEMSAAIRAQRERQAVPRTLAPPEVEPRAPSGGQDEAHEEPGPETGPDGGFLSRLLGR
jgi:hypothetical protein